MLASHTLHKLSTDVDFDTFIKIVQADAILTKAEVTEEDFEEDNFLQRLCNKCRHDDIFERHFLHAIKLNEWEQMELLGGLGGSKFDFPEWRFS